MSLRAFRKQKIAAIVVVTALLITSMPMPAYALLTQASLSNYISALRNKGLLGNGGALLSIDGTGAYASANMSIAYPPEVTTEIGVGWNFDFGMNCGGMDFNAEAYANLNMQQLVQWLKQILVSFAFNYVMSLKIVSSTIGSALDTARAMGQGITQLLQSPCELGAALGKKFAEDGGFKAFQDCMGTSMKNGLTSSWYNTTMDCARQSGTRDTAGNVKPGRIYDYCVQAIQLGPETRRLLSGLLGNAGYRKDAVTGKLVFESLPKADWPKMIQNLYKTEFTNVKTALNHVQTGGRLTTTDLRILNGPGVRMYTEDINSLYIITQTGGGGIQDAIVNYLAATITVAELAYIRGELDSVIARCEGVKDIDDASIKRLEIARDLMNKAMDKAIKEFQSAYGNASDALTDMFKRARRIVANGIAPNATVMSKQKFY